MNSFKRKQWQYLVLDEAQHIKNYESQRWRSLISLRTRRRLLLTGTPLQNNLMELWSLLHFLMPTVFASRDDFKDWFNNPITDMIEGNSDFNSVVVQRLHKVRKSLWILTLI
jgi:E1A-binding protein p400